MSGNKFLYLSRADVEKVGLEMRTIIELLEKAFFDKGHGQIEMPPKPGIHTMPDAFIHAMPAYIPSLKSAGIKWVSGYPENYKRGLPYITGLLILNDTETGIPLAVMDCTWITAMCTGRRESGTCHAANGRILFLPRFSRPETAPVGNLRAAFGRCRRRLDARIGFRPAGRGLRAYDDRRIGRGSRSRDTGNPQMGRINRRVG